MSYTITINKANVYNEIAKTTAYLGAKAESAEFYDKVFTTDADREMLERYWNEAGNAVADLFKPFIDGVTDSPESHGVELGRNFEIEFTPSSLFDSALLPGMRSSMHSYFVEFILSRWLTAIDTDRASSCATIAAGLLEDIKNKLYYKRRPGRTARNAYSRISKIAEGLFGLEYTALDYAFAEEYFRTRKAPVNIGGCSAVESNGYIGRNYDWLDNKDAVFGVHTPAADGRNEVWGISGTLPSLTSEKVDSGAYSDEYRLVPFYLQDGRNDKGLFAEINVVPYGGHAVIEPSVGRMESVCSVMLVRYILDRFGSVDEAVDYLAKYVEIYMPEKLVEMGYEPHYMLCDGTKCKVLEFFDGRLVTVESSISTNFHINLVDFGPSGRAPAMTDGMQPSLFGMEYYGSGIERWNILNAGRGSVTDMASMRALMDSVLYTRTYTETDPEKVWYSEFVGGEVTVDTDPDDPLMAERIALYRQRYAERSKDNPQTWHTTHQSIYCPDGSIWVAVRESGRIYEIKVSD